MKLGGGYTVLGLLLDLAVNRSNTLDSMLDAAEKGAKVAQVSLIPPCSTCRSFLSGCACEWFRFRCESKPVFVHLHEMKIKCGCIVPNCRSYCTHIIIGTLLPASTPLPPLHFTSV